MPPLFVSFVGDLKGKHAAGWIVTEYEPLINGQNIVSLCHFIESKRGYDPGTVVISNFRRLEQWPGNGT